MPPTSPDPTALTVREVIASLEDLEELDTRVFIRVVGEVRPYEIVGFSASFGQAVILAEQLAPLPKLPAPPWYDMRTAEELAASKTVQPEGEPHGQQ